LKAFAFAGLCRGKALFEFLSLRAFGFERRRPVKLAMPLCSYISNILCISKPLDFNWEGLCYGAGVPLARNMYSSLSVKGQADAVALSL
jgi:hypothetical protein